MKNYLPLALGLALSDTRAEEPKECIDALNLTVEIKPSVYRAGIEGRIDSALQGVQKFYWKEVSLPVTWKYQTEREPNDIHITFGNTDDCTQDWFPDIDATIKYIKNNGTAEIRQKLQGRTVTPSFELELVQQREDYLMGRGGVADQADKRIYVFPYLIPLEQIETFFWDSELYDAIIKAYATVTTHELGHILLGLRHAETKYLDTDDFMHTLDIMYPRGTYTFDNYGFSEEDKQKILSQVCHKQHRLTEPKEQK